MSDAVLKTRVTDAIPDEIDGFKVTITHGPMKDYETGLVLPGRYGVFATLTPATEELRKRLISTIGRDTLIVMSPIHPDGLDLLDIDEEFQEQTATWLLYAARRKLHEVGLAT